jgi:EAL domain-containing protein (putative c-di-GMP-specific phosphodiesterase class I)
MYAAKAAGGGLRVHDEDAAAAFEERARRIEELKVLLAAPDAAGDLDVGTVEVHYQPQVDVLTGATVGAEALVRWRSPRLGLVYPDGFIDLVEEHGLMGELTTAVLWQAARQAAIWRDAGLPLRMAVNLSTSCLAHPDLLDVLDDVLTATALEPADLVLEITETTLMADPARALVVAREITDRGVALSIDDYGTGYSSLAYLNDLPATELKLDRIFTARLTSDPRTAAIVAGTVTLAHHLGLRLVAEGVEDAATLAVVRSLGGAEAQGYLHSRPLPAEAFTAWLLAHSGDRAGDHVGDSVVPGV